MPLDARKLRGDPKCRAQLPLLTRVEDGLEVRQERVDVDVGQLLRRVGLARRFKRAVSKSRVQLQPPIDSPPVVPPTTTVTATSHLPQCFSIASITSGWSGSMDDTTYIWTPHSGQHKESIS
jgi:hypothetical protein